MLGLLHRLVRIPDPHELGRLRAAIAAVATVDRERGDRLEAELADLEDRLERVEAITDELYLTPAGHH